MTKGSATALFLVVATLANILLTALFFFGLLFVYGLTLGRFLKVGSSIFAIFGAFVAAVVLSALVYNAVLKRARKRFDLEKRFGLK